MSVSDWIHLTAAALTVILLIAASISDVRRYRIPNTIVYAIVVLFVVGAAFNLSWPALGWSVLAGIGMFLLGAGLFACGLFGGGDVKLIAALALWTGVTDLPRFLLVMTIAGGLLGIVWMAKRRRQGSALASQAASPADAPSTGVPPSDAQSAEASPSKSSPAENPHNRIPYGVAIAVAGLHFFITSVHSPFAPIWPWLQ